MNLDRRITFDSKLRKILEDAGLPINIYYGSSPKSSAIKYPCLMYKLDTSNTFPADNKAYIDIAQYTIYFKTKEPRCAIHNALMDLGYCKFVNKFTSDGVNVFNYRIYN